jgi:hypothetical protein
MPNGHRSIRIKTILLATVLAMVDGHRGGTLGQLRLISAQDLVLVTLGYVIVDVEDIVRIELIFPILVRDHVYLLVIQLLNVLKSHGFFHNNVFNFGLFLLLFFNNSFLLFLEFGSVGSQLLIIHFHQCLVNCFLLLLLSLANSCVVFGVA